MIIITNIFNFHIFNFLYLQYTDNFSNLLIGIERYDMIYRLVSKSAVITHYYSCE